MPLIDHDGWESGGTLLNNIEAEGTTLYGTIVSGALRPGSLGSYHAKLSGTDTSLSSAVTNQVTSYSGRNTHVFAAEFKLTPVPATTQKDVSIMQEASGTPHWEVRYTGASDSPAQLRFFVNSLEIDAAHSYTAPLSSAFALAARFSTVSPFPEALYIDLMDGVGWRQIKSANSAAIMSPLPTVRFGKDPGKGNSNNVDIEIDNFTYQVDGGLAVEPVLLDPSTSPTSWIDCLIGVPNNDGPTNGWKNHAGTACGTTSTTCSVEVSEVPSGGTGTFINTTSPATQTFSCTDPALLDHFDVPYGVKVCCRGFASTANQLTLSINGANDGRNSNASTTDGWFNGETHDYNVASTIAWTPAGMKAATISVLGNDATSNTVRELYKSYAFRKGPIGKVVFVDEGVAKLRGRKRAGMHFVSLAPPAAATPPVTPNRRRWVWVS